MMEAYQFAQVQPMFDQGFKQSWSSWNIW
jgi:hypothetical protein